jgi:hypothetical protein
VSGTATHPPAHARTQLQGRTTGAWHALLTVSSHVDRFTLHRHVRARGFQLRAVLLSERHRIATTAVASVLVGSATVRCRPAAAPANLPARAAGRRPSSPAAEPSRHRLRLPLRVVEAARAGDAGSSCRARRSSTSQPQTRKRRAAAKAAAMVARSQPRAARAEAAGSHRTRSGSRRKSRPMANALLAERRSRATSGKSTALPTYGVRGRTRTTKWSSPLGCCLRGSLQDA